ncbi:cysteine hydrolase family protein [Actinotignum urinale]|uniref:isochorismatase family protein n=1 Tax=Actinotignum urinale TaxID=190146 RepID=UPI00146E5538|nr:isochorismatase family protein [Actinotignum urinale]MDY5160057.1 isochorismatase family protein [Actinotignum urinale]
MTTSRDSSVLVLVNLQNDYLPGGSLGTKMGNVATSAVADYVREHGNDYAYIVATKDWHIDPGTHFSDNPDFVDSWPPHCVKGTTGADFGSQIDVSAVDEVFYKGEYEAAYSGFAHHQKKRVFELVPSICEPSSSTAFSRCPVSLATVFASSPAPSASSANLERAELFSLSSPSRPIFKPKLESAMSVYLLK